MAPSGRAPFSYRTLDALPVVPPFPPVPEALLSGPGAGHAAGAALAICRRLRNDLGEFSGARVLDVGCGLGMAAHGLAAYLGPEASYLGFDVHPGYLRFCRALGLDPERFRFEHFDLHHPDYNPDGAIAPTSFRFPWADGEFDLVLASSVFVHLDGPTAERYLAEVFRVLAPGGSFYASFYVLDDASRPLAEEASTYPAFPVSTEFGRTADPPGRAAAYDYDWLADRLLRSTGADVVSYGLGTWRGGAGPAYEDTVIVRKPREPRLLPPEILRLGVGPGPFWHNGRVTRDAIQRHLGLLHGRSVLDLGSGLGRVAYYLQDLFDGESRYLGFDVSPAYVDWCRDALGLDRRFQFQSLDVRSSVYHQAGGQDAATVGFPLADESYDVVIANSLFTHLESDGARNYLGECHRVLSPGGRLFATFFVLDPESLPRVVRGEVYPQLPVVRPFGRIADAGQPELGVAFDAPFLARAFADAGFALASCEQGNWRGKPAPTYQDVFVLWRP